MAKKYSSITSANWHLTTRCNYACKFCFMKKLDSEVNNLEQVEHILIKLQRIGIEKINFVGGEPLIHPLIFDIISMAKKMNFITSIVSNGYCLNDKSLSKLQPFIDWIGLSIDSCNEDVEEKLGRGYGGHVNHIIELSNLIHKSRIKLKINTAVTRLNFEEDLKPLIAQLKPQRWKVFQILNIKGQNDEHYSGLSITADEYSHFIRFNQNIKLQNGQKPIFETNDDMIDSYLMISPGGNLIQNSNGSYSLLPLNSITSKDMQNIIDVNKYVSRGGVYS